MLAEHRRYVANGAPFSTGAPVFNMLIEEGLKETDTLCDVGCGSLRVGRFLIMYLNAGGYYGIEPNDELLAAGILSEVTDELCRLKDVSWYNTDHYHWATDFKFDWVLISGVLVHKTHNEIAQALNAAYNMLKPGGSLIVDYYPSSPHWIEATNPPYPQIAPHYRECLLMHPGLRWTGLDKELFGAHYIRLVK